LIQLLIEQGAYYKFPNNEGKTPFDLVNADLKKFMKKTHCQVKEEVMRHALKQLEVGKAKK
jgi:hypothetical protein